jgi:alkylated DNA repair dioxygenase AlkB
MDFQSDLFGGAVATSPGVRPLDGAERTTLTRGAWVEVLRNFVVGADDVLARLVADVPWRAERRPMYDRIVDVPRLTTGGWHEGRPRLLDRMARCLSRHYGLRLVSISANLYRDGNDSVAWHGDQVGRQRVTTIVAIVSLGSPRTLLLRPEGGGPSVAYPLHSGDLLVQGGTCQRTFQHSVPKRAHAGPRISVMFRQRHGH